MKLSILTKVSVPLVSDMTHTLGTKKIDWKRFDCIFASVSPMLSPPGVVLVFVRSSKIRIKKFTPLMLDYTLFKVIIISKIPNILTNLINISKMFNTINNYKDF